MTLLAPFQPLLRPYFSTLGEFHRNLPAACCLHTTWSVHAPSIAIAFVSADISVETRTTWKGRVQRIADSGWWRWSWVAFLLVRVGCSETRGVVGGAIVSFLDNVFNTPLITSHLFPVSVQSFEMSSHNQRIHSVSLLFAIQKSLTFLLTRIHDSPSSLHL